MMQSENFHKFSSKETDSNDDSQEPGFSSTICSSFWNGPCFCCHKSGVWEKLPAMEKEREATHASSLWRKGIKAFKEWSELVAGPKWKTFIRRFNKTGSKIGRFQFQYDPMSYALNFDAGQNDQLEEDQMYRNFSSRYAGANPVSNAKNHSAPK